ncbi:MAG: glycosyltransferase family 39 protein, partial [Anaerolineae bacterium]|nr:glycosyltransferase family 39 protein [Anaerolineae bacterium]
ARHDECIDAARHDGKRLLKWERWAVVGILLLAWFLRWVALWESPPGWRDDDLIEVYTFSKEILESGPVLYFSGAEGHEPFYHTIRAPLLAVAGVNLASVRWLSATYGTLTVLLTWAVGRRLFTREVGILSGAAVAVSFWGIMYSRFAVRHIATLPPLLLALYWGWRQLQDEEKPKYAPLGIALGTAITMLTYYAGRMMPALLLATLVLVGWKKEGRWKGYLGGLVAGVILTIPTFWTAAHIPGGDARVSNVALPLTNFLAGDPEMLIDTILTTLGMFHATGDPEWLYNIADRPVFGWLGATLFFIGILTRLAHLDQPNARLLLMWLATGIAPAFISLPASSLSHTIVALPAVYLLVAMPMKALARRIPQTALPVMALTLLIIGARDIPDYFYDWPQSSMVQFLYRGDYRNLAHYLDQQPEIQDAAVGSFLFGPWDRLSVETDNQREDIHLRWVNPERALVGTGADKSMPLYFQDEQQIPAIIQTHIMDEAGIAAPDGLQALVVTLPAIPGAAQRYTQDKRELAALPFGEALTLEAIQWETEPVAGEESYLTTWWAVIGKLPLPPNKLIPYKPPPGVYNGPRLKVFVHLLAANGQLIAGDDGLWVDPYTLQPGDSLVQWHHFTLPADAPAKPYTLAIGLYDPKTGERWLLPDGSEMLTFKTE